MIRGLSTWSRHVAFAVAWAVMDDGLAQPGYAETLKTECARAGRPVPGFSNNDCSICHQNLDNYRAYQSGNYLDVLCELSGAPPVNPGPNTAPVLDPLVSLQNLVVGETYSLTITATDLEDDKLKLSAQRLPRGAKFKKLGKVNGKWTGVLVWKPRKKQGNKTFVIKFKVREARRPPRLKATQSVSFFVAPAIATVQKVDIAQTRYADDMLTVSGQLHLTGADDPRQVGLTLTEANGAAMTTTHPDSDGAWRFAVPVAPSAVPCRIEIAVDGRVMAVETVKPIALECHQP